LVEELYETGEELGSGAFSVVVKGTHRKSKQAYAIKVVDKEQMNRDEMLEELSVMSKLDHPNIVKFKEIFESPDKYYVVLELITGGELFDRIIELRRYTEKDASHVMSQALNGLKCMHDKNLIHRDLKPENLLLSSKNPDATVKLADFGFATICAGLDLDEMLGTPPYFAPELSKLRTQVIKYGKAVDIWAMGVIMYILLSGFHPFQIDDEDLMLNNIENAKWNWLGPNWDKVSDNAKDLIQKMMCADPLQRYTVNQCLAHPWFAGEAPDAPLGDIADQIKQFQARKKLRGAIFTVMATNRMKNLIANISKNRSLRTLTLTRISLKVISGTDLAIKDSNGKSDPYLKIFYGTERYKTSIQKKTLNPKWAEEDSYVFPVFNDVDTIKVECWDWDRLKSDDFMGQFEVDLKDIPEGEEVTKNYTLVQAPKEEQKKNPTKKTEGISGFITLKNQKV